MPRLVMTARPVMLSPPGPMVRIDGETYLYFGGYNYLGLAGRLEVIEAGCRALRDFGVHPATTRAGFGTSPPVLEVERRAAEFFGTEDAFYFGSGYSANQIMIAALGDGADALLLDSSAHYSAREVARLANLPVLDFDTGETTALRRLARERGRVLVVANGVGPATGQLAPVREWMEALQDCAGATLLLDDAHGFGVLGPRGRGLYDQLGLWERVNQSRAHDGVRLAVCGTLAKALGGYGGIIPGAREFLRRARAATHHFDGATPPPSATAASSAKGLEIALTEPGLREQLRQNIRRLRTGLRALGLEVPAGEAANLGVAIGSAEHMRHIHATLRTRGILVPYFEAYSGVPGEGVLRIALFADHTFTQVDRLIAELRPFVQA